MGHDEGRRARRMPTPTMRDVESLAAQMPAPKRLKLSFSSAALWAETLSTMFPSEIGTSVSP